MLSKCLQVDELKSCHVNTDTRMQPNDADCDYIPLCVDAIVFVALNLNHFVEIFHTKYGFRIRET